MRMLKNKTHFARFLTTEQVSASLDLLESICDGDLAELMTGSFEVGHITVKAPDGDTVFAALQKGPADAWMCRFHREVFEE